MGCVPRICFTLVLLFSVLTSIVLLIISYLPGLFPVFKYNPMTAFLRTYGEWLLSDLRECVAPVSFQAVVQLEGLVCVYVFVTTTI